MKNDQVETAISVTFPLSLNSLTKGRVKLTTAAEYTTVIDSMSFAALNNQNPEPLESPQKKPVMGSAPIGSNRTAIPMAAMQSSPNGAATPYKSMEALAERVPVLLAGAPTAYEGNVAVVHNGIIGPFASCALNLSRMAPNLLPIRTWRS